MLRTTTTIAIPTMLTFIVFCPLYGPDAAADSAIAAASKPAVTWSYAYGHASPGEARSAALERCANQGGEDCAVLTECPGGGFGSIYIRQAGPGARVEAIGAVCGSSSAAEAAREARRVCEWQVAKNLDAIAIPKRDATFASIRRALARSCPGMGNCQCSQRHAWLDRSDAEQSGP